MNTFEHYTKGVNVGGWLSQCCHTKEHYDTFIGEKDIEKIASLGVDHIRLPIDYNLVENESGEYIEDGFVYIDNAISWCEKYGLNMVLDLHKTAGFSFDEGEHESGFFESEKLQERFYALWKELARRYGKYSGRVAFELLNEVTDREYRTVWNNIIKECITGIREYAKDSVIIVGGYWQNSPDAVKDLDRPYDKNIVFSFHCYDPLMFTHQGAEWVKDMPSDFRQSFEDAGVDTEYFIGRFKSAYDTAKKYGVPLYCGEYGVIDRASPADTVKWYKAINAAFVKLGISRAAWSYKAMDFGLSDDRMKGTIDELIKYL